MTEYRHIIRRATMPTSTRSARPNGHHTTHDGNDESLAQCPYCGSALSVNRFKQIQLQVEKDEKARIAALEASLNARFAAKAQAEVEKAKREAGKVAEAQIKALRATQDAVV